MSRPAEKGAHNVIGMLLLLYCAEPIISLRHELRSLVVFWGSERGKLDPGDRVAVTDLRPGDENARMLLKSGYLTMWDSDVRRALVFHQLMEYAANVYINQKGSIRTAARMVRRSSILIIIVGAE